jgi:hypothetical protein
MLLLFKLAGKSPITAFHNACVTSYAPMEKPLTFTQWEPSLLSQLSSLLLTHPI